MLEKAPVNITSSIDSFYSGGEILSQYKTTETIPNNMLSELKTGFGGKSVMALKSFLSIRIFRELQ